MLLIPLATAGQPRTDTPRIGFLQASPAARDVRFEAFKQKLRELGQVEGKTIAIEYLSAEGRYDRLPGLAAELVRRKVDVLVTDGGTPSIAAALRATRVMPTVFCGVADPVAQGIVASLARPGGNVTGMTPQHADFAPKLLELLKEMIPSATRIAVLSNPTNSSLPVVVKQMQAAAHALRLELHVVHARAPEEFEGAMAEIARSRPAALVILREAMFTSQAGRLTALAAGHRLPTMGGDSAVPKSGGLASYAPNTSDMLRGCAVLADKILKGAKPADLPVEQPTRFELVVNLNAAKALGLTIPQSVLLRADQVIQ